MPPTSAPATESVSLWAPLKHPVFRSLWIATVVSNLGTAMQGVGAAWMLVELQAGPTLVALLQTASSLPIFLLGLPAGVLADLVDRRRLLILANMWMIIVGIVLAAGVYFSLVDAHALIYLTFALGLGAALSAPAFQAIVPELAAGPLLAPAVSLNSLGVNIARTIGPALGGLMAAATGPEGVFVLNALSTVAVVFALLRWRRVERPQSLPPEHFFAALRASARYLAAAPHLKAIFWRTGLFFTFASAPWALLPVLADERWGLGPGGYGTLLGVPGAGSIAGALQLTRLKSWLGASGLVVWSTCACGATMIGVAATDQSAIAMALLPLFGVGWICVLTVLNVSAQGLAAQWVRARVLAMFVVALMGAMALGGIVWGAVAEWLSAPEAVAIAGVGLLMSLGLTRVMPVVDAGTVDLGPAASADPSLTATARPDAGAVLVCIDYRVLPENQAAFADAMRDLAHSRRRTGALSWFLWQYDEDPERFRESFIVESWTDHLRQQQRRTSTDQGIEESAARLSSEHAGPRTTTLRSWPVRGQSVAPSDS
ncbi:MAG TPA: MFS transporter [Arenimonas sp.]|uniref:MFS transporter n=1 Tax=Arenimonas sp. TaxID=1872635 RepID=UPI002D7FFFE9|nr:MFS transporter [Arenimonas sp.]HEU0153182.1 MFS transporter [Arenimonas sp.]